MSISIENRGTIISDSEVEIMVQEIIKIFEAKKLSYGGAITLLDLAKERMSKESIIKGCSWLSLELHIVKSLKYQNQK